MFISSSVNFFQMGSNHEEKTNNKIQKFELTMTKTEILFLLSIMAVVIWGTILEIKY